MMIVSVSAAIREKKPEKRRRVLGAIRGALFGEDACCSTVGCLRAREYRRFRHQPGHRYRCAGDASCWGVHWPDARNQGIAASCLSLEVSKIQRFMRFRMDGMTHAMYHRPL